MVTIHRLGDSPSSLALSLGEIDIIASQEARDRGAEGQLEESSYSTPSYSLLVFVKSRLAAAAIGMLRGLLSITQQSKQNFGKLLGAFGNYPTLADHTCRFDVARVCCQRLSKGSRKLQLR